MFEEQRRVFPAVSGHGARTCMRMHRRTSSHGQLYLRRWPTVVKCTTSHRIKLI